MIIKVCVITRHMILLIVRMKGITTLAITKRTANTLVPIGIPTTKMMMMSRIAITKHIQQLNVRTKVIITKPVIIKLTQLQIVSMIRV